MSRPEDEAVAAAEGYTPELRSGRLEYRAKGEETWYSEVFDLAGKRLFVAHGDNMNVGRKPMLRLMNSIFRSKVARALFSWLVHPDIALRFGRWWSGKSRKAHYAPQSREVLNPLIEYATELSRQRDDIDYYLFGHMHYAYDGVGEPRMLFLGDWHTQPNYISLDNNGEIKLNFTE